MLKKLFSFMSMPLFMTMAKVDGPLFSLEARGKIADAIVFFPWKGRHVVRQWLKPTNPKSTKQGYLRVALKAIGKFIAKIQLIKSGDSEDSRIYQQCTSSADAGMNWNAYLGQGLLNDLQAGGTFITSSFLNHVSDYSTNLDTDCLATLGVLGTALGLEDFTFDYGYTTAIPVGLQMYLGAVAAYKQSIIATAPFNTAPKDWVASDGVALNAKMTSNV